MSLGVVPVVLLASGASRWGSPPVARVSACASSRSTSVSFFSRSSAMSAPYPDLQWASPRSRVGAKVGYRFAGRTRTTRQRRDRVTQDAGATMDAAQQPGPEDVVTIKLPAAGAYLSVLRTATAGLAARLDFTLDEIEDLRIAVDEACAMLLTQAVPGADLECRFALESDSMRVGVSVLTLDGQEPSRDTFAWTVLAALAGEVDSTAGVDNRVTITLLKRRSGTSR